MHVHVPNMYGKNVGEVPTFFAVVCPGLCNSHANPVSRNCFLRWTM